MHDERRALDMPQELMAQALALARALDKTWDIRDDIGVLTGTNHAEVGHERGERIVGDLGTRGAHTCDQRAFAHARHAHQRGIGHELHLELDPMLLGGLSELRGRRRTTHRGHEMRIAQTAGTTRRHHDALPIMREVGDLVKRLLRLGIELTDNGSHGYTQHKVGTRFAVLARTLAVRTAFGTEMMLESIIRRGRPWAHTPHDGTTCIRHRRRRLSH